MACDMHETRACDRGKGDYVAGGMAHACNPSSEKAEKEGITCKGGQGYVERSCLKQNKIEQTQDGGDGSLAEVLAV